MNLQKKIIILIFTLYASYCFAEKYIPRALPVPITKDQIIQLAKSGVSDEIIINQITTSQTIFKLNSQEIIELKTAGVSNNVINFMIQTAIQQPMPDAVPVEPTNSRVSVSFFAGSYYNPYYPYYDYWNDPPYWYDPYWYPDWRNSHYPYPGSGIGYGIGITEDIN